MKIELKLNEREENRLRLKAAEGGMSVSELLTSFASDLIHGEQTNGSDERMYARAWYDRCGFTYFENSFLSCLAQDMIVDQYVDFYRELLKLREELEAESDEDKCAIFRSEIYELEQEISDAYDAYGLTGDWEQEMVDAALKWGSGE